MTNWQKTWFLEIDNLTNFQFWWLSIFDNWKFPIFQISIINFFNLQSNWNRIGIEIGLDCELIDSINLETQFESISNWIAIQIDTFWRFVTIGNSNSQKLAINRNPTPVLSIFNWKTQKINRDWGFWSIFGLDCRFWSKIANSNRFSIDFGPPKIEKRPIVRESDLFAYSQGPATLLFWAIFYWNWRFWVIFNWKGTRIVDFGQKLAIWVTFWPKNRQKTNRFPIPIEDPKKPQSDWKREGILLFLQSSNIAKTDWVGHQKVSE